MSGNAAKLAAQIAILQTAVKLPLDPDTTANTWVIAQIAGYLDRGGLTDIRNLHAYLDTSQMLNFFYDSVTAATWPNAESGSDSLLYTTTQSSDANDFTIQQTAAQYAFNEFVSQHTVYMVFCKSTPDDYPIFYAYRSPVVSQWTDALHGIVFLVGFTISAAFPALAGTIGQAVLGADLAAQYPLLATSIGNVCINTVMSGGNVQGAVESAVVGSAGSGVGGIVATATDSAIIGQVANAVTKAALTGGNIQSAALTSLAKAGLNSVGDLPSFSGGSNMQLGDDTSGDTSGDLSSTDVSSLYSDAGYGSTDVTQSDIQDALDYGAAGVPGDPLTASNPATSAPSSPGAVVASSGGLNLTQLAAAALPLITAYVKAGSPGVMTSSATVTAQSNGTLRNANGTTTLMPVGTPYLTPAGVITNNGNGTYSTVASNGSITTTAYPAGTPGTSVLSNMSPVAILAIAAVTFLALR